MIRDIVGFLLNVFQSKNVLPLTTKHALVKVIEMESSSGGCSCLSVFLESGSVVRSRVEWGGVDWSGVVWGGVCVWGGANTQSCLCL